jgi:hypothetical protein
MRRARSRLRGMAVGERTNNTGPPANLFHDPRERIIGSDLLPVDVREGVVGQRLTDAPELIREALLLPGTKSANRTPASARLGIQPAASAQSPGKLIS